MRILGIETSCDETAMSVIEISEKNDIKVLSNVISSQVKLHAKYGGVVPSLAAREHTKNIGHVFELALKEAGIKNFKKDIDAIAVTRGPGLGPSLLVGMTFAKTLSWIFKKPLIGVNHLEGHVYSNWLEPVGVSSKFKVKSEKLFPVLNIIVSGGHTELVLMKDHGKYEVVGETLDDAVGEAFDKVARLLDLGYPGGPAVAQRAKEFKVESAKLKVKFPRPMEKSKNYNFSYSGLKTSVLYKIRDLEKEGVKINDAVVNEICYEFQNAAIDVLVQKTIRAAKKYDVKSIMLSGGVSANSLLRLNLNKAAVELGVKYFQPKLEFTGDNAAMIAVAGYFNWKHPTSRKASPFAKASGDKSKGKEKTDYKSVKMDANLNF